MRPITDHIPKPLLPIAGKPLLEAIMEKASDQGFTRLGVNSHHLACMIEAWLKTSRFAGRARLFYEPAILNTGGALKNAEAFLEGGDFLVHNGDIVSDADLAALYERHRLSGNIATLAVFDRPAINNVLVSGDGLFVAVGRGLAPVGDERLVAFSGIAVYSPAFLRFLPAGASSVLSAWVAAVGAGQRIGTGTFDISGCAWSDIGSPAAYASTVFAELGKTGETVYADPAAGIGRDIRIDGAVVIEKDAKVGDSAGLRNCIILPGAEVSEGARIRNSIVGPAYAVDVDEASFGTCVAGKGVLIGSGGSDRRYYRRGGVGQSRVVMECAAGDIDFDRHIAYTGFFRKYGIPVPALFSSDRGAMTALFEDMGDVSLYSWRRLPRPEEETEAVYLKVIEIAARLHGPVSDHVSECPSLAGRIFDYDYLRWETAYFLDGFIKGLNGRDVADPDGLGLELHRLALKTDSFTKRIIHRDFQSQNIMITPGGFPRVIDFQGARMAPPAYDIASMLWDPYAPLQDDMRGRILSSYLGLVGTESWFDRKEFEESLPCCRLQRHMQALGAYGYLSMVKGKIYFLKHAPEAVRLLKEDISPVKAEFPLLADLIRSL
jgi:NDP-sugar pyrophosphorylase family protein/aminoglycoside/choline kinase family phosphotransferase